MPESRFLIIFNTLIGFIKFTLALKIIRINFYNSIKESLTYFLSNSRQAETASDIFSVNRQDGNIISLLNS